MVLLNFGLGILGIWVYTLFKALPYIQNKTFNIGYFILDNKLKWGWSILMLGSLVIGLHFEPKIGDTLIIFLGLDITHPGSFITLGLGLANLVKDINKSKEINKENNNGL
jgi:hypothetical protein